MTIESELSGLNRELSIFPERAFDFKNAGAVVIGQVRQTFFICSTMSTFFLSFDQILLLIIKNVSTLFRTRPQQWGTRPK